MTMTRCKVSLIRHAGYGSATFEKVQPISSECTHTYSKTFKIGYFQFSSEKFQLSDWSIQKLSWIISEKYQNDRTFSERCGPIHLGQKNTFPAPLASLSLVLTMILDYSAGLSLIHHIIVHDFHTQTNKQNTNRCNLARNILYCIKNGFFLSI